MKYKFKIILNVLLHYGKYRKMVGRNVRILKNNGLIKYNKLIGETGHVIGFEFYRIEKPIIVKFNNNEELCFAPNELEVLK